MTWKQKLMSRKFAVVIATAVAALAKMFFPDVDVDPAALAGVAGILMAYLVGQSWVDKTAVAGQAEIVKNESLIQAQAYIKYLEGQFAEAGEASDK